MRRIAAALLSALLMGVIACPGSARAGEIGARCGAGCTISISGRIDDGDDRAFHALADAHPAASVVLSGPGGKVAPAIAIGREIRARRLRTIVPAGASCASACSLIWLAGTRRALAPGARIGFHALSVASAGGGASETHIFDFGIRRYLSELGYAMDVTATIVNTPASTVHWRDAIELNANGIATDNAP